ncbi:TPA: DUF1311 domain-containing protein [Neisseria meningitidis]|uniref:DUF1311 domain-containing protein n=1 Tax=Neisseria meningitidis TaxID=487 RepID=UPI001C5BA941|nr:DUF1311 domain-containing protein [Neisseria meningitidis]
MPSERRPFQTAFLSNRKTVGKLAERVQSRYDGLHKFKHVCSAAMALIKEPLDKAKQRNEELEAAEEAAAQEALGREQEVDRVSEWEERYKLSRSEFEQFWKGLPQTVQNKLQASQKTWKSGMDKICANNAKAEGETPNGIKVSELACKTVETEARLEELYNRKKALIDEMVREADKKELPKRL